ncbi:MAG: thiamine-phosphate kinase [Candidatus Omnitrophota bacterium]|jgi:thiamine-monophosphate kinase
MKISRIGEFGLIERFRKSISLDASVIKGSGDDCAVLKFDKNNYQLFTCDMLVEGVDFRPGTDPYLIGRKALAVSLSDIAACAGLPRYCLVSMALPKGISVERVDRLSQGIFDLAKAHKLNIVGGDLSRASRLSIDISILGSVEKKRLALRSGAKKKDIIFTSGPLGGSLRGRHLKFTPRLKEARFLAKNFKINSMIDISDGLAQDLGHILKESSAGAVIYERLIPLNKEARGLSDALYTGEDFELLFTLSRQEAKKLLNRRGNNFPPIGEIVEKKYGLRLVDKKGREKVILPRGFRHF